jgi:Restriction endonuclease
VPRQGKYQHRPGAAATGRRRAADGESGADCEGLGAVPAPGGGLLRELGFSTEVNARIAEANGAVHPIDVASRRTVAGVDLLWIVECKHWNKPVPMEKVLVLRSLVIDLGADRGLLMSESGLQSGAIRTASQMNITLSSLADLRANAADEILAARVLMAEKTLIDLAVRVQRDLRFAGNDLPRMLAAYAARPPRKCSRRVRNAVRGCRSRDGHHRDAQQGRGSRGGRTAVLRALAR